VSTGSRKLFAALLDQCIARKVVPICCFTPRINAAPSVVALIPQEERLDDSKIQILPPGFHVVYLPYSGKQVAFILGLFLAYENIYSKLSVFWYPSIQNSHVVSKNFEENLLSL
jgi:hypothetical protein